MEETEMQRISGEKGIQNRQYDIQKKNYGGE